MAKVSFEEWKKQRQGQLKTLKPIKCFTCHGTPSKINWIACPDCGYLEEEDPFDCPTCEGTEKIECPDCDEPLYTDGEFVGKLMDFYTKEVLC